MNIIPPQQTESIQIRFQARAKTFENKFNDILAAIDHLSADEKTLTQYCYTYIPIQDLVSCPFELILRFVRHAILLYATVPWLKTVPVDIFLNFVLFYRVNNEFIEDFRQEIFDELWPRVKDKSVADAALAALAVNYWCAEVATYQATDDRTASPKTVIRRTFGRCGEESTLLVSALRSVGIPARQCYTPRWAHCDDNHAWVEVYVNGQWAYMGACEPEPVLNRGWFTAAASKAMLVHSRAFTDMLPGEILASRSDVFCTVNNTGTYGQTKELKIRVVDNECPLSGLTVRAEIVNYSELFPLLSVKTDENGEAIFLLGQGDVMISINDGDRFSLTRVDLRHEQAVTIDFPQAVVKTGQLAEFELYPPAEHIPESARIDADTKAAHAVKFQACNQKRETRRAAWLAEAQAVRLPDAWDDDTLNRWLSSAVGNYRVVAEFLAHTDWAPEDKAALLDTLREKDFVDIRADVLNDVLASALPWKNSFPPNVYRESLLAPRVENEMLLPQRQAIRAFFAAEAPEVTTAPTLWAYLQRAIQLQDDMTYGTLIADAKEALRRGVCDARSLDVLFVTACRALGIPARLNQVTGIREFYTDGLYRPINDASLSEPVKNGTLMLQNVSGKPLVYATQISIGKFLQGVFTTLNYEGLVIRESVTFSVEPGFYRVITTARQIDGSVRCRLAYAEVSTDQITELNVTLAEDSLRDKFKYMKLNDHPTQLPDGTAAMLFDPIRSGHGILLFAEPGREPTEHLFNEMIALSDRFNQAPIDLVIVTETEDALNNVTLQKTVTRIPSIHLQIMNDDETLQSLHRLMDVGDERKPFVLVMNQRREGLYAFSNYNVGLAAVLLDIVAADMAS